jgi:predicted lipoprotein with Yx(FWY)xxD motif
MRKLFILGLILAAVTGLITASPPTPGATMSTRAKVVVSTRRLPKLGTVLVNHKGFTLYMFVRDKRKRVTCVRTCAKIWPPLKLRKGARLVATRKAKRRLLGSDRDPAGGRVVTYHKWPLYTYVADTRPGQAKGQALKLNGGLWYVLAPSGKVIRRKP